MSYMGARLLARELKKGSAELLILSLVEDQSTLLFGVSPTDPITFAGISLYWSALLCWRVIFRRDARLKWIRLLP